MARQYKFSTAVNKVRKNNNDSGISSFDEAVETIRANRQNTNYLTEIDRENRHKAFEESQRHARQRAIELARTGSSSNANAGDNRTTAYNRPQTMSVYGGFGTMPNPQTQGMNTAANGADIDYTTVNQTANKGWKGLPALNGSRASKKTVSQEESLAHATEVMKPYENNSKAMEILRRYSDLEDSQDRSGMLNFQSIGAYSGNFDKLANQFIEETGVSMDEFRKIAENYSYLRHNEQREEAKAKKKEQNAAFNVAQGIGEAAISPVTNYQAMIGAMQNPNDPELGRDYNSPFMRHLNAQEDTKEAFEAKTENLSPVAKTLANLGYDLAVTGTQSAAAALTGEVGLGSFAAGGYASNLKESDERGLTEGQAQVYSAVSGGLEYITERLPIEHLKKIYNGSAIGKSAAGSLKPYIKAALEQMGEEASEELINGIADTVADGLINGDKSKVNATIQNNINDGMSEDEATRSAYLGLVKDTGYSMLVAALSTGVSAGPALATQAIETTRAGRNIVDYENKTGNLTKNVENEVYIPENRNMYASDEDYEQAQDARQTILNASEKVAKGQRISGKEARTVYEKASKALDSLNARKNVEAVKAEEDIEDTSAEEEQIEYKAPEKTNEQIIEDIEFASTPYQLAQAIDQVTEETDEIKELIEYKRQELKMYNFNSSDVDNAVTEKKAFEMGKRGEEVTEEQLNAIPQADRQKILEANNQAYNRAILAEHKDAVVDTKTGKYFVPSEVKIQGADVVIVDSEGNEHTEYSNPRITQALSVATQTSRDARGHLTAQSMYKSTPTQAAYAIGLALKSSEASSALIRTAVEAIYNSASVGHTSFEEFEKNSKGLFTKVDKTEAKLLYNAIAEEARKSDSRKTENTLGKKTSDKAVSDTLREALPEETIALLEALSEKIGYNFVASTNKNARGSINPGTRQISIGTNSIDEVWSIVAHEAIGEYLQAHGNEADVLAIQDDMFKYLESKLGSDAFNDLINQYQSVYRTGAKEGSVDYGKSRRAAANEMFNDTIFALLSSEEGAKDYVSWLNEGHEKSFFEKIKDFFRNLVQSIRDYIDNGSFNAAERAALEMDYDQAKAMRDRIFKAMDAAIANNSTESINNIETDRSSKKVTLSDGRNVKYLADVLTHTEYNRLKEMIDSGYPAFNSSEGDAVYRLDNKLVYARGKENFGISKIIEANVENDFDANKILDTVTDSEIGEIYDRDEQREFITGYYGQESYKEYTNADFGQTSRYDRPTKRGKSRSDAYYAQREQNRRRVYIKDGEVVNSSDIENDVRHSFAGIGAETADKEQLKKAQELQKKGMGDLTILETTGWFLGMDNKWKFEIPDNDIEIFKEGNREYVKNNPDFKRYLELENKILFTDSDYTEEEYNELMRLDEVVTSDEYYKTKRYGKLSDFIQHDELFRSYPWMEKVDVLFVPMDSDKEKGYADPEDLVIALNLKFQTDVSWNKDALKSTLLHEIQHIIQGYEGFAGGSNPEWWANIRDERIERDQLNIKGAKEHLQKFVDKAKSEGKPASTGEFVEQSVKRVADANDSYNMEDHWAAVADWKATSSIYHYENMISKLERHIDRLLSESDIELYYNSAGEIEARDTANRANLTKEQRIEEFPKLNARDVVYPKGTVMDRRYSIKVDSDGRSLSKDQQKYFKDSKVVDNKGQLLVVYHGTEEKFDTFKPNEFLPELNGPQKILGYFSEDKEYANRYGQTTPYYLNITNPLVMEGEAKTLESWDKFFKDNGITDVIYDSSVSGKNHPKDTLKGGNFSGETYYTFYELFDSENVWYGDGNITERIAAAGYDGIRTNDEYEKAWMPFNENAIKRTDNTNPTESDNVRYSKKLGDIEQAAVEHFGTTDSFRVAGYMLTDGTLLDFSGAHWLEGESPEYIAKWKSQNDIRQVDHEDIYEVMEASGDNRKQFMDRGNIRLNPEAPGFNLSTKTEPTAAQYRELKEFIREVKNNPYYDASRFYVDIEDTHPNKISYANNLNEDRIINDIKKFYETGELPQESSLNDFRYSKKVNSEGKELTKSQDDFFKDSKAVDENGNLLVLYHGSVSDEKFNEFNLDAKGSVNGRVLGDGFYFTPDKTAAKKWSKGHNNIYKVYLNITNPYYASADNETPENVLNYLREHNSSLFDKLSSDSSWWGNKKGKEAFINDALERANNAESALIWIEDKTKVLKSLGYDGIIYKDSTKNFGLMGGEQYVAFYPQQIKKTTNKKPTESADIRKSIKVDWDNKNTYKLPDRTYEDDIFFLGTDEEIEAAEKQDIAAKAYVANIIHSKDFAGLMFRDSIGIDRLLTRSTRKEWDWQLSESRDGEPIGHENYKEENDDITSYDTWPDKTMAALYNEIINELPKSDARIYVIREGIAEDARNSIKVYGEASPYADSINETKVISTMLGSMNNSLSQVDAFNVSNDAYMQIEKSILKKYNAQLEEGELAANVSFAFAYMQQNKLETNYDKMMNYLLNIGDEVIKNSNLKDPETEQLYNSAKDVVKKYTFKLSEADREEIKTAFGGNWKTAFGELQKAGIKLNNDKGVDIDTVFSQLQDEFLQSAGINLEKYDKPSEQILGLLDAMHALEPTAYLWDGANSMDKALTVVADIINDYYSIATGQLASNVVKGTKRGKKAVVAAINKEKDKLNQRFRDYKAEKTDEFNQIVAEKNRIIQEQQNQIRQQNEQMKKWNAELSDKDKQIQQAKILTEKQMKQTAKLQAREAVESYRQREERARQIENIKKTGIRLIKWLNNPTDNQHVPAFLQKPLGEFLAAIDFLPKNAKANSKNTLTWQQRMQSLRDTLVKIKDAEAEADGSVEAYFAENMIAKELISMMDDFLGKETWDEFTQSYIVTKRAASKVSLLDAKDLATLNKIMSALSASINNMNKTYANSVFKEVSKLARASVKEIDALPDKKDQQKMLGKIFNFLNFDEIEPITYFEGLGAGAKSIYQELRDGFNLKTKHVREADAYMDAAKKELGISDKELSTWKNQLHKFKLTEGTVMLNTTQIMTLYKILGRKQGKPHVAVGGIKSADFEYKDGKVMKKHHQAKAVHIMASEAQAIIGTLTPEQIALADKMQQFMANECAKWGNRVTEKMFGYKRYEEKDYFPLKTDAHSRATTASSDNNVSYYTIKNRPHTKPITPNANNAVVLDDIFDVFTNHVVEMAEEDAYVMPIADAMRWFNYSERVINAVAPDELNEQGARVDYIGNMQESIDRVYGDAGLNYFRQFIKDINGDYAGKGGKSEILSSLMSMYKAQAVGANMRVVIQQPTAVVRASDVIEPKYLIEAMGSLPKAMEYAKKAQANSEIAYWKAQGYYETYLGQSFKEIITGDVTLKDKFNDWSGLLAGKADDLSWGIMYRAAELKVAKEQPELKGSAFDKAATKLFEDIVDYTQVVDTIFHKSQWMRSQELGHKVTSAFMAEPTKTYNMLYRAYRDAKLSGDRSYAVKRLRNVALIFLFEQLLNAMITGAWDMLRDDEKEDYLTSFKKNFSENAIDNLNPLNLLPIAKEITSAIQGYDATAYTTDAIYTAVDSFNAMVKIAQGKSNKTVWGNAYQISKAVSQITGVPVANAMREFKTVYNLVNDFWGGKDLINSKTTQKKVEKTKETNRLAKVFEAGDLGSIKSEITNTYNNAIADGKTESEAWSATRDMLKEQHKIMVEANPDDKAAINNRFKTLLKYTKESDRKGGYKTPSDKEISNWIEKWNKPKE